MISPPAKDLEAAPYGKGRFHIEARLDGRSFEKFPLDMGVGDVWMEPITTLQSNGWLEFAGIPSTAYPAISPDQQFAEKIHAYALPRGEGVTNLRLKDLIDMNFLIYAGGLANERLLFVIQATFERRQTHSFVSDLNPPPESWASPYAKLAEECELSPDITRGL